MDHETSHYDTLDRLSMAQISALRVLLLGGTVQAAAIAAGRRRETVSRWLNHHHDFISTYNSQRENVCRDMRDDMMLVVGQAMAVCEDALAEGNVEIGFRLLQATGALDPAFDSQS